MEMNRGATMGRAAGRSVEMDQNKKQVHLRDGMQRMRKRSFFIFFDCSYVLIVKCE